MLISWLLRIFIGHWFYHVTRCKVQKTFASSAWPSVSFTYRNRKRHGKIMGAFAEKEMDQLDWSLYRLDQKAGRKKSQHEISTSQQQGVFLIPAGSKACWVFVSSVESVTRITVPLARPSPLVPLGGCFWMAAPWFLHCGRCTLDFFGTAGWGLIVCIP